MSKPLVQIVMAVFNGENYLNEQIKSIQNQSFKNWELLISDDNSTDRSLEIVTAAAMNDRRIKIVLNGRSFGCARDHFLALTNIANAPYLMYSDQDDIWDCNKIEITLAAMKEAETGTSCKPILVSTDLRVVDSNLNVIDQSFLSLSGMKADKRDFGYFLSSCLVTGCTMMINEPLKKLAARPVLNADRIIMHDWWLSLIASAFGECIYVPQSTISYRQHGNNSVGAQKRSLFRALLSLKQMNKHMLDTLEQAEEFKATFYQDLNPTYRNNLDSYLQLKECSRIQIARKISEANAWRNDAIGNLGMIIALMI